MGNKSTWSRKRFLLYLAGCLMGCFLWNGCVTGLPHDRPRPYSPTALEHLSQGELFLLQGDYDAARKESCYLLEEFTGEMDDRALFLLGMVWVHPDNPQRNTQQAAICFRRIADQHPDSPLVAASSTWLALIDRIEENERSVMRVETAAETLKEKLAAEKRKRIQLEERLQQMKAIDLSPE